MNDTAIQDKIDSEDNRTRQITHWVHAYNIETVAVRFGKSPRHEFMLPDGPPVFPPLSACYDPGRDQYVWPFAFSPPLE